MSSRNDPLSEYLHRWGAKAVPFNTTDAIQPFETPATERAMELLDQTAALRSFMLLSGDNGVGKSALVARWIGQLEPKLYHPVAITHATLSGSGLLSTLLLKLGCAVRHLRSHKLAQIEEALNRFGRVIPVLVLDEAQLLTPEALEEIRLLLGLNLPTQPLFAFVLVGDNYLLDTLRLHNRRALYSRIACVYQLPALDPPQAQAYLNHQFEQVGVHRPCFDEPALQMLIAAAEGIPRTLNLLARTAWIEASRLKADRITPDHVRLALALVPLAGDKAAVR
jgi:general secretion pathway protein A